MADPAGSSGGLFGSGTGLLGLGGTGFTTKSFTEGVSGIGGLVGGIEAAQGYRDEAGLYGLGASAALEQENAAEVIGSLEKTRAARQISLTESSQRAAAAKNGLAEAGSAADLLRESVAQGNQTQQAITFQTELKADQFRQQAYAAEIQQKAAQSAASGAIIGGVLKGVASIASFATML